MVLPHFPCSAIATLIRKKRERTNIFIRSYSLPSIPFSLPGFEVTEVISTKENLIVCASSLRTDAECPACHAVSQRIHSYYQRTPRDLPVSGQTVQLHLRVRRFRCHNASCSQKTFGSPVARACGPYRSANNPADGALPCVRHSQRRRAWVAAPQSRGNEGKP